MSLRNKQSLNLDWRFFRGDEPEAWQNRYDDSNWRRVTVPHDWSVEEPFSPEHSSGTGYLSGGVGWYRKHFSLQPLNQDSRVTVCFEGVYNNSQVWCNGYYLGKRPFGYSEFVYDISHCVRHDGSENIIVVRVDKQHTGDSRWFTGVGIYRGVSVTCTDAICIDTYGVFAYTTDAVAGTMAAEVSIRNPGETDQVEIRNTILLDGNILTTVSDIKTCSSGITNCTQSLTIPTPLLWSPESPVLYTLVTEILRNGVVVDKTETKTGLRDIRFDATDGFFLNGKNYSLKGVCVHHDAGCLGAAVRPKVWQRRLNTLKAMGCNAIRMSHNPHMNELYDLCDSMGFFVIDEAFDEWEGVKNKWTTGHNVYPPAHYGYYEDFPTWGRADLTAMVLRDRNHPSIILWSIGNEIDYPNDPYCHPLFDTTTGNNDKNKPFQERLYDPGRPNAERLVTIARDLVATVKEYDITRPVTAALAFPELSNLTGLSGVLDVVGYNYKEQHYKDDHGKYPGHIILGTENGHHIEAWQAVTDNDFIAGQFLWTGIDYLGETPGWPSHGSAAGAIDLAGFEKPAYYYRQALWVDRPVLQLAASYPLPDDMPVRAWFNEYKLAWNFAPGETVNVACHTNCQEVELFLNDRSLGRRRQSELSDMWKKGMPLIWPVEFEPGQLRAVGYSDGVSVESILNSTGAAVAIKARVSDDKIVFDGQDMTHIEFELVDTDGRYVADAYDMIRVSVEGGILLGLENGDLADTMPYSSHCRRAHKGRLLAYVGAPVSDSATDVIRVCAEGFGLKFTEVIISNSVVA